VCFVRCSRHRVIKCLAHLIAPSSDIYRLGCERVSGTGGVSHILPRNGLTPGVLKFLQAAGTGINASMNTSRGTTPKGATALHIT